MFTRSSQCVHFVESCSCGVTPGAVPYHGLSASGESPRHPLMHSVEPGAAYTHERRVRVAGGRAGVQSDRFTYVRHIESGFAITFDSPTASSSSQSPTWIVWVTMSG